VLDFSPSLRSGTDVKLSITMRIRAWEQWGFTLFVPFVLFVDDAFLSPSYVTSVNSFHAPALVVIHILTQAGISRFERQRERVFPALRLPEKLPLLLTLLTYIHVGNTHPCCRRAGLFRPTPCLSSIHTKLTVLNRLVYNDERRSVGMINKIIASVQYD
jgi:hypothetical protein